jgi:hypothetical protein
LRIHKTAAILSVVFGAIFSCIPATDAETLQYHTIQKDNTGKIIPWYNPGPSVAYDYILGVLWGFWKRAPNLSNGVKEYMQAACYNGEGWGVVAGDVVPMAISSWTLYFAYTGDTTLVKNMMYMADFWLDNGMSGGTDLWADLPFPTNLQSTPPVGPGFYDGQFRAGAGYLEPGEAGSFGHALLTLYKITGTVRYRDAAIKIANTLAGKISTAGDDANSPWPYRVHARNGTINSSYTASYTETLRLFDELIRLNPGYSASYSSARTTLTTWLKNYPMKTNDWGPFFEDIGSYSNTEINAVEMARYILENPQWDANWKQDSRAILDFTFTTFGNTDWSSSGVTVMNEQSAYMVPGNSHTSRYASVELIYADKTGDTTKKDRAIRELNWATYMVNNNGENTYLENCTWYTDGYGDFVRHYLRSMTACPQLAPSNANHLLGSTSVIQKITYGGDSITYTKFDSVSTELVKCGAWTPQGIRGGTMAWDNTGKVLTVTAVGPVVTIYASASTYRRTITPRPVFSRDAGNVYMFDLRGRCVRESPEKDRAAQNHGTRAEAKFSGAAILILQENRSNKSNFHFVICQE